MPSALPRPAVAQRVTVEQAVRAYTLDAAYQLHLKQLVGSIEAAKRADMIVLNRNIFELEPHRIHEVSVLETWVDGKPVYRKP